MAVTTQNAAEKSANPGTVRPVSAVDTCSVAAAVQMPSDSVSC